MQLIPKGTTLALNMHYNTKGPAADATTTIGLVFAKGPIEQVAITAMSGTRALAIPPGDANYEARGNAFVFAEDSHIISLLPRMNERGKDYKYTLVYPDGRSEVLLSVPKFRSGLAAELCSQEGGCGAEGQPPRDHRPLRQLGREQAQPGSDAARHLRPEIMNGYLDYTIDTQNLTRARCERRS